MNERPKLETMVKNELLIIDDGINNHGWNANWVDGQTNGVTCSCGDVELSGILWTSLLKCKCGKVLIDVTALRMVGDNVGAATFLDPDKVNYEDGRVWVALVGDEKVEMFEGVTNANK